MTHGLSQRDRDRAEQLAQLARQEVTLTVKLTIRATDATEEEGVTIYSRTSRAQAEEVLRQLTERIKTDLRAL